MKIRFRSGNLISVIVVFFVCMFVFVAPLLILSDVGFNESTITGLLLLIVVLYIQVSAFLKSENGKDKYKNIIQFTVLPGLSGFCGLILYHFNNPG